MKNKNILLVGIFILFVVLVLLLRELFVVNLHKNKVKDDVVSYNIEKLKIASFNIQVLGRSKVKKKKVVDVLVKILSRYDIIFVQELRDSSGLAIKKLLARLNNNSKFTYKIVVSKRLGLTSSKEQYVFFYRDYIKLISTYQYKGKKDDFNRDPFAVLFEYKNKKIAFLGAHIDPDDVKKELNYLDDVYYKVSRKFSTNNIILLGDFNADCNYLSGYELKMLDLKRSKKFIWYIDSSYDTTVSKTDCAYDRLITNKNFTYVVDKVKVFDFQKYYNLTLGEALKVSDHFPIEFELLLKDWKIFSLFCLIKLFLFFIMYNIVWLIFIKIICFKK